MPTTCLSSSTASRPKRTPRAQRRIAARLAALAIAVVAVILMYQGERWLLGRSPAIPDELTIAACAIDAVNGDPSSACMRDGIR